jgi:hypothetical protein
MSENARERREILVSEVGRLKKSEKAGDTGEDTDSWGGKLERVLYNVCTSMKWLGMQT